MKSTKYFYKIQIFLAALLMASCLDVMASSHREAPLIAFDPLADNTDVYAFRSPDDPNTVTIIANYIPGQLPHGGPNYYTFGEDVRYEIHIDNDAATTGDDIIYRFTFSVTNEDPTTFFNIRLGLQNQKTTYTMEKSTDGGQTFSSVISNGVVPAYNIGDRSIEGGAGLGTTYASLFNNAITTASSGETVFCGPVDDPFYVDLGGIFDLGDAPRQNSQPRDGLACYNVSTIAIKVPISDLQKDNKSVGMAANILDPDFVIGVWASASRQQIKTRNSDGTTSTSGGWVQVSRLGMPLTNEAVIPIGQKDEWNSRDPYGDNVFYEYFYNPELALYMDTSFFAAAVPAFSALRVQRKTNPAMLDFGNTQSGLFPLKNTSALDGTAMEDGTAFEDFLLPGDNKPRSIDLNPIFHTGVPNLRPYQLATGKNGDPLAAGKPFINNFLPNGGDMLRLNMAVPITDRSSADFSSEGLISAAVLGLTDSRFNGNSNLEFIPNMDGFPNGRRLEDDVTRIELQAVSGVVLAAIGLGYDDPSRLGQVLGYSTGVENNDTTFRSSFPYVQMPWRGTGKCGGLPIRYNQPQVLEPSVATGQGIEVVSFTLVDADNATDIRMLNDGDTIDKSMIGSFSIRANVDTGNIGSVLFKVNGTLVQRENVAPYAIMGGTKTTYNPYNPIPGTYKLRGTPYTMINGKGSKGVPEVVTFVVVDNAPVMDCNGDLGGTAFIDSCGVCAGGNTGRMPCDSACQQNEVVSFTLVSANTGMDILPLNDGDTIDKNMVGSFSIRANVCSDPVGSVLFNVNGSLVQKENLFPYDIAGGTFKVPNPYNPAPGMYTLVATPYSNGNGKGTMGIAETVNYVVLGSSPSVQRISNGNTNPAAATDMLTVYPNPTSGEFTIELLNAPVDSELLLLDASGKVLRTIDLSGARSGSGLYQVNLSEYAAGMYLVKLRAGSAIHTKRVIKQ